jgi:hypothetical protein
MKTRDLTKRESRIITRGEVSNHSHIITGECEIIEDNDKVIIKAGKNCVIKHLLESVFVEQGIEQWTGEHKDIALKKGESYEYIQQVEYDPYAKIIQTVKD